MSALFAYGLNFIYLIIQAIRFNKPDPVLPTMTTIPRVTVQVPIYNERFVAERIIDAVAQMSWPHDRLEIQILDDSSDETIGIAGERVAVWQSKGVPITHLTRNKRTGYKAGALEHGTRLASGDFMAVFDADFVPPPDFLERTVPHLLADQGLAFVQARWEHLNADDSSLTRIQALALDAHFGVEQFARSQAGHMFNFNGTAGVWRREAVQAAGGWKARTLTEDLDLSYRVLLAGWHGLFLRDLTAPAELPPTMAAFRRQQARWAQGSIECAVTLLPQILRSSTSVANKAQAVIHLSGYLLHVLLFMLGLLYPLIVFAASRRPEIASLYGVGALFSVTIFAPTMFFTYGQVVLQRKWWRSLPHILPVSILGVGMILNTMRALIRAFGKGEREFKRTPKWGEQSGSRQTYRLGAERSIWLELIWGIFNLSVAAYALVWHQLAIAIFSTMFGAGAIYVTILTLAQAWRSPAASLPRPIDKSVARSGHEKSLPTL